MTQQETWERRWEEVRTFIAEHHRNPSRYDPEERGRYVNWLKHNRKQLRAGEMPPEREERFRELLELTEKYKRKNQHDGPRE